MAGSLACAGPHATQPTVVVRASDSCTESIPPSDPYEAALARARCEHPDVIVHPHEYVLRRVPSPANVKRFVLVHAGRGVATYDIRGGP